MPKININLDGDEFVIKSTTDDMILDIALYSGVEIPYACRVGMCNTCRCKLIEGTVFSLIECEDEGYILACQSSPVTDIKLIC